MPEKSGKIRKVTVKSVRTVTPPKDSPSPRTAEVKAKLRNGKDANARVGASDGSGFLSADLKSVRSFFLQGLSIIYFIAFLSIYLQIEGLYGTNGVLPIKGELKLNSRAPLDCLKEKRSLICILSPELGLSPQHAMEFFALVGAVLAGFGSMCVHCCVAPVMVIMWALYFSIFQVGGVFLSFQWDTLLLEAGVLGFLAAPWFPTKASQASKPRDLVSMWMVKWLLFRLMFSSGVVKLMSGCPTWWGLSALNFHFESQCLPTAVAYYAHQLPQWILRLFVVGTYFVEIIVPFGFFAPSKFLRRFSFYAQVLFQISIIVTGNYNFFNLLTMVLCVSLLDADFFDSSRKPRDSSFTFKKLISRGLAFGFLGLGFLYTAKMFGLTLKPDYSAVDSKITFNRVQFDAVIALAVPYAVALGFLTLASTVAQTLFISLFDVKGCWKKFTSLFSSLLYGVVFVGLFAVTLVPFTALHKETNGALWSPIKELHGNVSRFHVASSYGLFRRMTGTEKGRPEVILEYSDNVNGPWKEYEFLYKPGDVSAAPSFVFPHQPRLDWQMWFAALGSYHDNQWLVSLTYRLLQGEPSVQNLLDASKNPTKPPKFVRASFYYYTFTKANSSPTPTNWWSRERVQEYLPVFSVDHPPLVEFMKNQGYLEPDVPAKVQWNENLALGLNYIRSFTQSYRPEYVIWSSLGSIAALILTSKLA